MRVTQNCERCARGPMCMNCESAVKVQAHHMCSERKYLNCKVAQHERRQHQRRAKQGDGRVLYLFHCTRILQREHDVTWGRALPE